MAGFDFTPELVERVRRVRALLDTRNDYVPLPRVLVAGSTGASASKKVPCGVCKKTGVVSDPRSAAPTVRFCPMCDGTGWRRRRAHEEEWDQYLDMPVREAVKTLGVLGSLDLAQDIRRLDGEIARLQADQDSREGRIDHERYGWERTRAAYDRAGSYNELRRVLLLLGEWWSEGYYLLTRDGTLYAISRRERVVEEMAVAWVAHTMRGQINVPPWVLEEHGQRRQRTVVELADEGLTTGQIARKLHIPKEKVRRILKSRAA